MLFLPLTKADAVNRLVYARAAAEEPDKSREIMDYASGRPQFELWSGRFKEATLGKSLGNIRAMHNPRHLAGVVKQITYNDDAKAVDVCFKVLDQVDWVKVEEGGYTGLSIGGGYLKKWTDPSDPSLTRYTPRLAEISLVDSPCIASARIMELQKQDGTTTEVMLKGVPRSFKDMLPPPTFGEALAKISFSTFGRAGRATQSVFEHPATQKAITYGKKAGDIIGGAGKVMGTVRTAKELALLGAAAGGAVGLYRSRRHDRKKGTVAGSASTPIGTQPLTKAFGAMAAPRPPTPPKPPAMAASPQPPTPPKPPGIRPEGMGMAIAARPVDWGAAKKKKGLGLTKVRRSAHQRRAQKIRQTLHETSTASCTRSMPTCREADAGDRSSASDSHRVKSGAAHDGQAGRAHEEGPPAALARCGWCLWWCQNSRQARCQDRIPAFLPWRTSRIHCPSHRPGWARRWRRWWCCRSRCQQTDRGTQEEAEDRQVRLRRTDRRPRATRQR
jgi:hypothetical protein